MTNEECLKKAIEKAVGNGWEREWGEEWGYKFLYCFIFDPKFAEKFFVQQFKEIKVPTKIDFKGRKIPSHTKKIPVGVRKDWRFHQHKMLDLIQEGEEPLKYLSKFLEEEK